MTWAEVGCLTDWATQAPLFQSLCIVCFTQSSSHYTHHFVNCLPASIYDMSWPFSQVITIFLHHFFFNFFFPTFIYFWLRERQSMNRGGAEREGDTESETGSRLWAVSTEPDAGLEPTNHEIMTWAEVGCLTDWATQAPQHLTLSWFRSWSHSL